MSTVAQKTRRQRTNDEPHTNPSDDTPHSSKQTSTLPTLTSAQANYLELIYVEQLENGTARGCAIAKTAGVTRATVAATLRSLKELGLISYYPYGPITMTEQGLAVGKHLHTTRTALTKYFSTVLGIPAAAAQKIANAHELLVSPQRLAVLDCLRCFIEAHQSEWEHFRTEYFKTLKS